MAAASTRSTLINYTGDVVGTNKIDAASNSASPASVEIKSLSSGANTITLPTGGSTVTGVTIVPPAANTVSITLKGVTGDTGFRLHDTDPTSLSFYSTVTTFVLTTGDVIAGVRFFWT